MLYIAAQHTHVTLKPMQTLKALVKPSSSHAMALMPLGELAIMAVVSIAGEQVCSYTTQGADESQATLMLSIQMHVAHAFQLRMQHC